MTAAVTRSIPPPILIKVANPVLRRLLSSPAHRGVSGSLVLLHLTGRKSGRRYDLPVGYHDVGGKLTVFTSAPWRPNVRGGADIEVTFRGRRQAMHADLDEDPESVAPVYQAVIESLGWQTAQRRLGITIAVQRTPTIGELAAAVRESGLSVITLTPAGGPAAGAGQRQ